MSKEFAALRQREHAAPATSPPSASTSGLGAMGEFVELPRDPRPAVEVSPQLGRGLYQLMSALLASFIAGAALTPTLYVPRGVWQQVGRKVQAYAMKLDCFDSLHEQLLQLPHPPVGAVGEGGLREADEAFAALQAVLGEVHERLAQQLPYLPSPQAVKPRRPPAMPRLNAQALTRLLTRAGDAASIGARKLDEGETVRYCEAARGVLEGVAVMRQWHEWVDKWRGEGGLGGLEGQLAAVDEWLYVVFVSVLLPRPAGGAAEVRQARVQGVEGSEDGG